MAYSQAYYATHRKQIIASQRAYNEAHPEKQKAYNKAYKKAHPEKVKAYKKAYKETHPEKQSEWHLKSKYKIGLRVWQELLDLQDGKCAICGTTKPDGKGWTVDHDHSCCPGKGSCGKCIRGILCASCNLMLGAARDNPRILRHGAEYLEGFGVMPKE
jgi:hypothetical protein